MHDVEQLMRAYRSRATASVSSKLDVLMDVERLRDPRIVPFLLRVLRDQDEPMEVRIHVLKRLRSGRLASDERRCVARAMKQVLSDHSSPGLQLQAALALGGFVDVAGVTTALGRLALDADESLDLRYSAFTALERAGPTSECVALMRQLATDEALGRSARSVISAWHRD